MISDFSRFRKIDVRSRIGKFAELWKKWYFRLGFDVLIVLVVLVCLGYLFMERIMFPSPSTGVRVGNLTLNSGNAVLDALWLKKENAMLTVLYSHGNGEQLAWIRNWVEEFPRHGYNILAYDYAGYGGSTGKAGEKQACTDIETAYRFLTEKEKIPPEKILVIGFSIGTGPSSYLASKYPVKGLLLAAPFASATQVVFPFSLPFDRFPSAERLSQSQVPVLVFHGTADRIIPCRNGKKVFDKAAGRKKLVIVPGADHNDLFAWIGERFWNELNGFFPK